MGRTIIVLGDQLGLVSVSCKDTSFGCATYANGFRTARQGGLQVTGSYRSSGVSGFSFKGVYRAPMGTTSREASWNKINHTGPSIRTEANYHSSAWNTIPAESNAITVFHLAPLVFESIIIHIVIVYP